ncbi:pentapeptide repeat-containing protein [Streptomyces avermitilis]|uniref:pentapeptide repeat-containing protein n=1 Tax=Streptomyces avermitilis TaxID=33903 RepID=UPI00340E5370
MADPAPATSPRTWWFAASTFLLIAGFLWLLWKGPWFLDSAHLNKQTTPGVASVVTGFRTAIVAVGAGIVAGTGLVLSHRTLQHTRENDRVQAELTRGTLEVTGRTLEHAQVRDRDQAELTREGQVTDRFTNAIGQLASERDVEMLGGVYALERIMRDSEKDHPTVVEVLAAFVRYHAPAGVDPGTSTDRPRPVEAVQAALTVLARRPKRPEPFNIDLRGTDLRHADLNTGNLANAQLSESDLRNANLISANLQNANLARADLRGAVLRDSAMEGAVTFQASLSGTYLAGVEDLTAEQIIAAFPSDTTELPDDLAANQEVQERIADLEMEKRARRAREVTGEQPPSDEPHSDPPSA